MRKTMTRKHTSPMRHCHSLGGNISAAQMEKGKPADAMSGNKRNAVSEKLARGTPEFSTSKRDVESISAGRPFGKPRGSFARGGHIDNSMREIYHALHSHFENEPQMKRLGATKANTEGTEVHRETGSEMRKASGGRMWIQKAIKHPGALHKALRIPKGTKIPEGRLEKAEHSRSPLMRKRAHLAETLKKLHR